MNLKNMKNLQKKIILKSMFLIKMIIKMFLNNFKKILLKMLIMENLKILQ